MWRSHTKIFLKTLLNFRWLCIILFPTNTVLICNHRYKEPLLSFRLKLHKKSSLNKDEVTWKPQLQKFIYEFNFSKSAGLKVRVVLIILSFKTFLAKIFESLLNIYWVIYFDEKDLFAKTCGIISFPVTSFVSLFFAVQLRGVLRTLVELLAKIINGLKLLTIIANHSILDA